MYQEDISLTKEQKAQISQDLAKKKPKVKKLNPVFRTHKNSSFLKKQSQIKG